MEHRYKQQHPDDPHLPVSIIMKEKEIKALLEKYTNGTATPEEKRLAETFFESYRQEAETEGYTTLSGDPETLKRELLQGIYNKRKPARQLVWQTTAWRIAASVLLVMAVGYAAYQWPFNASSTHEVAVNNIVPGGDKAILLLADGTQVELNDESAAIPQQGVAQVVNTSGTLSYLPDLSAEELSKAETLYNTISTPRGGQYRVTLSDGSHVWLNASSSLKYPAAFTGNERIVELTGEAYFEVAKHEAKPFRVITDNLNVEVLGTHFNVMAYNEEGTAKATLIEGSVRVTAQQETQLLTPGQQANRSGKGKLTVIEDRNAVAEAIAWKSGMFRFEDASVTTIMRQVARWYAVDIRYEEDLGDLYFSAAVSRQGDVTELLRTMELTGAVWFEINERQITVKRGKKPGIQ